MLGFQLLEGTFLIETIVSGQQSGLGTGFFVEFPLDEGDTVIVGVTAAHVIREASSINIRLNQRSGQGDDPTHGAADFSRHLLVNISCSQFAFHKTEDLAVFFVGARINELKDAGFWPLIRVWQTEKHGVVTSNQIVQIEPGSRIIAPMFPLGLANENTLEPFIRGGVVAGRITPGSSCLVLDLWAHEGSSGSPVVFVKEFIDLDSQQRPTIGTRCTLIGIVTGARVEEGGSPTGLSEAVTADKILEIVPMIEAKVAGSVRRDWLL